MKGKKQIQPIDDASLYYDSYTNTYFDMSKTSKESKDDGIKYILKDGKTTSIFEYFMRSFLFYFALKLMDLLSQGSSWQSWVQGKQNKNN